MSRVTLQELRVVTVRVGVVACVAVACFVGAGRLDDAVAIFDYRADANAAASFRERTYPESAWVAGNARVLDDARLWMPDDATYVVVEGRELTIGGNSGFGGNFLLTLFLPRTQTDDSSAPWAFCYACTRKTLGPEYQVLSDSGQGFLFARRRS